jgi:hypothetical protein
MTLESKDLDLLIVLRNKWNYADMVCTRQLYLYLILQ